MGNYDDHYDHGEHGDNRPDDHDHDHDHHGPHLFDHSHDHEILDGAAFRFNREDGSNPFGDGFERTIGDAYVGFNANNDRSITALIDSTAERIKEVGEPKAFLLTLMSMHSTIENRDLAMNIISMLLVRLAKASTEQVAALEGGLKD